MNNEQSERVIGQLTTISTNQIVDLGPVSEHKKETLEMLVSRYVAFEKVGISQSQPFD